MLCTMIVQYILMTSAGPVEVSQNYNFKDGLMKMAILDKNESHDSFKNLRFTVYKDDFICDPVTQPVATQAPIVKALQAFPPNPMTVPAQIAD